jgi:hypothetical protein
MTKQKPGFTLRLPDEIEEQIRKAAAEKGRKVTQEIIYRLEESFDQKADDELKQIRSEIEELRAELEHLKIAVSELQSKKRR